MDDFVNGLLGTGSEPPEKKPDNDEGVRMAGAVAGGALLGGSLFGPIGAIIGAVIGGVASAKLPGPKGGDNV